MRYLNLNKRIKMGNNKWNLPQSIINKFGLIDKGNTATADHFIYDARTFEIPEIGDVFVIETPNQGSGVDILFRRKNEHNRHGVVKVSFEMLEDFTRESFIKFINKTIEREKF